MPIKMMHKDEEGNTYLIINKWLFYALLLSNILIIIIVVYLGLKIQFWFSLRGM